MYVWPACRCCMHPKAGQNTCYGNFRKILIISDVFTLNTQNGSENSVFSIWESTPKMVKTLNAGIGTKSEQRTTTSKGLKFKYNENKESKKAKLGTPSGR